MFLAPDAAVLPVLCPVQPETLANCHNTVALKAAFHPVDTGLAANELASRPHRLERRRSGCIIVKRLWTGLVSASTGAQRRRGDHDRNTCAASLAIFKF